jgi:hypothetical protein
MNVNMNMIADTVTYLRGDKHGVILCQVCYRPCSRMDTDTDTDTPTDTDADIDSDTDTQTLGPSPTRIVFSASAAS